MSTDLVIARLGTALAALSEAKSILDTKAILDAATAAEIYARRQKLSDENIAFAHEVKAEALRQLGEYLAAAPKNTGAAGVGPIAVTHSNRNPTLAEQGIDKRTSAVAQKLAALPPEKFQQVRAGKVSIAKATATPKPKPPTKVLEPDDDIPKKPVEPPPPPPAPVDDEEAIEAAANTRDALAAIAVLHADDKYTALIEENRKANRLIEVLQSQLDEYMGKFNHTVSELKRWKRQCEKYERAEKEREF